MSRTLYYIHGDLWYENYILNDNNELVGIVDFEGSGMG
ncbi:phosphotransferase, partial [Enterococcus gallinarum]